MMNSWIEILLNWTPMIILIGVWIYFMRKIKGQQVQSVDHLTIQSEFMEQYLKITERIAVSLEEIATDKQNKHAIES